MTLVPAARNARTLALATAFVASAAAAQTPVGGELHVNTSTANFTQDLPRVAVNRKGRFLVVWQDGFDFAMNLLAQFYDNDGEPIGGNFRINNFNNQLYIADFDLSVGCDHYVVVWSQTYDSSESMVRGQRLSSDATQTGPEIVISDGDYQLRVSTDHDSQCGFTAAWEEMIDAENSAIVFRRFDVGGNPTSAIVQVVVNRFLLDLSHAADDSLVVVYAAGGGVRARRYAPDATPLGGEIVVNEASTGFQSQAAIDHADDGSFLIVWSNRGSGASPPGILARLFAAGGAPLTATFQVNTAVTAVIQRNPRVAHDGDGFVAVWDGFDQDGDGQSVQGRRFDLAGNPLTGEFQVNTFTTGNQFGAAIGAHRGQFVVAWTDDQQEAFTNHGIFAQRFLTPDFVPALGSLARLALAALLVALSCRVARRAT